MELTKEQRAINKELRPVIKAGNWEENRPRRHRVKLADAFKAALPKADGRWIRRVSNSMKRCGKGL